VPMNILGDFQIIHFAKFNSNKFTIDQLYTIKINNSETTYIIKCDTKLLLYHIYTNPLLYRKISVEGCIIIDVAFSMSGSEAIVESYYSVMKTHRKDGGQHNDTLDMRTLVDWSLPAPINCPKTVTKIGAVYRCGSAKGRVGRHRTPVLTGRLYSSNQVSKVVDRIANRKVKFPYFD